jgi:drug/metabolite transporter (DMT)-like permease
MNELGDLLSLITMNQSFDKSRLMAWALLITLVFVWGSSFILIKKGLEVFSVEELGALRISLAFLVLFPLTFSRFSKVPRKKWIILATVGIIGNGFPAFLFAKAQTGIDSNLAGILNSMTPLFTLIIAVSFFRFRAKWYNVAGIFIALAGAIGLISISGGHSFDFNIRYAAYVFVATICYATTVNLIKYYLKEVDIISITAFSFFFAGVPLVVFLLSGTGFIHTMLNHEQALLGFMYILILAVLGTALAMIAFNKVIKLTNPVFASSVTYMIPIVAVAWGIIDGEPFTSIYLFWILLVLSGVYLVNLK